eukprot:COSAG04_NODE_223_length_19649_cov_12.486650_11_plen_45_part_00
MPTMRQPGYTRLPPDGGEGGQRSDEIAEVQRLVLKWSRRRSDTD